MHAITTATRNFFINFYCNFLVEDSGFEPENRSGAHLQCAGFDHSPNPPKTTHRSGVKLVEQTGLEPVTFRLQGECSSI